MPLPGSELSYVAPSVGVERRGVHDFAPSACELLQAHQPPNTRAAEALVGAAEAGRAQRMIMGCIFLIVFVALALSPLLIAPRQ